MAGGIGTQVHAIDDGQAAHQIRPLDGHAGGDQGAHRVPGQVDRAQLQGADELHHPRHVVGQPGLARQARALAVARHVHRNDAVPLGEGGDLRTPGGGLHADAVDQDQGLSRTLVQAVRLLVT